MDSSVADGSLALLVDGNNVMGAAADGWWRDPPAAVRRLVDRIRCYGVGSGLLIEVVFDVPQPDLPAGDYGGIVVHYPIRPGRNAADDRIVEILDDRGSPFAEVVTSDRELAQRARLRGAQVTGAGSFLARLGEMGC